MFHLYYIGYVFVYLMYLYLSSEINIYLSIYVIQKCQICQPGLYGDHIISEK